MKVARSVLETLGAARQDTIGSVGRLESVSIYGLMVAGGQEHAAFTSKYALKYQVDLVVGRAYRSLKLSTARCRRIVQEDT